MKFSAGRLTSLGWMGSVVFFLYLPIFALVILSFNASPMVTSWGGWSLRWYEALANDAEIINGFVLSLKIAFFTACASVMLGTLAALALTRFKRFPGRTLFAGMVNSPLVPVGIRGTVLGFQDGVHVVVSKRQAINRVPLGSRY